LRAIIRSSKMDVVEYAGLTGEDADLVRSRLPRHFRVDQLPAGEVDGDMLAALSRINTLGNVSIAKYVGLLVRCCNQAACRDSGGHRFAPSFGVAR
jgi:hypothetical protein